MVRHVIIWKLKPQESPEALEAVKKGIKEGLEGLLGQIPGLLEIRVSIAGLDSSTGDLMLDSLFENAGALSAYAVHPAHTAVASGKVRPFTELRSCFDYEV